MVQKGGIIRIGPNELAFMSPQSYQDIYGHTTRGKNRFLKTDHYDNGDPNLRIAAVQDPEVHAQQRRAVSRGFSAKALRGQEDVVHEYVNKFIHQLQNLGTNGTTPLDASEAYNWLTFDIIGDLAFGEPFGAVAMGRPGFWITLIPDAIFFGLTTTLRRRLPLLNPLLPLLLPRHTADRLERHKQLSREKARKRLALKEGEVRERDDFFSHMIRKGTMSEGELVSQAYTFTIAGSETTSAALAGITYYLLANPRCLAELRREVRSGFASYGEITGDATAELVYLNAVIEEGLRIFPPIANGLPRYSPGAVIDGHHINAGVTVWNNNYSMAHDVRYWHQPDAFLPERWIGHGYGDEKGASQPFSIGPRACLGRNLAYLELRITLAKIIFTYDMELMSKDIGNWN